MARKSAAGTGTIRKKTVVRGGKEYSYWEARYTAGYDPGTGKQIQRSITGKTQKEVAKRLKEATAAIDAGTYTAPNKMTVGQWLDIWAAEYLGNVKPLTVNSYKTAIQTHIKPSLGAIKLEALAAHTIQAFYNSLSEAAEGREALSPKTSRTFTASSIQPSSRPWQTAISDLIRRMLVYIPALSKRKSSLLMKAR